MQNLMLMRANSNGKSDARSWVSSAVQSEWILYVGSVLALLLVWHLVAVLYFSPTFFPSPLVVAETGSKMFADGTIYKHVGVSLSRILIGFLIGSAIAAPIGLLMGSFRPINGFLDPYVQFFRFVPAIAWLTPAVIWFGIGETSKVVIIIYTTIFVVIINTVVGVSNVSPNKIWAARTLGATQKQVFFLVTLPATIPYILTGMRLAMGNSFMTVVSAEMIGAEAGIGFLISNSRLWMATDVIFLAIVILAVLGFTTDRFFRMLTARFAHRYVSP